MKGTKLFLAGMAVIVGHQAMAQERILPREQWDAMTMDQREAFVDARIAEQERLEKAERAVIAEAVEAAFAKQRYFVLRPGRSLVVKPALVKAFGKQPTDDEAKGLLGEYNYAQAKLHSGGKKWPLMEASIEKGRAFRVSAEVMELFARSNAADLFAEGQAVERRMVASSQLKALLRRDITDGQAAQLRGSLVLVGLYPEGSSRDNIIEAECGALHPVLPDLKPEHLRAMLAGKLTDWFVETVTPESSGPTVIR